MKSEIPCPGCGRPVAVQSRRNGERFTCPGCIATLILFDTPQGKRLALQGKPVAASPAKPPATAAVTAPPPQSAPTPPGTGRPPAAPAAVAPQPQPTLQVRPPQPPGTLGVAPAGPSAAVPKSSGRKPWIWGLTGVTVTIVAAILIGLAMRKPAANDSSTVVVSQPGDSEAGAPEPAGSASAEPAATAMTPDKAPAPEKLKTADATPAADRLPEPSKPKTPAKLSPQEIVKLAEPSVCRLSNRHGALGTGFVVGPRLIATNEHVLGTADETGLNIEFVARNRTQFRTASLAYTVTGVDLVLLRISDLPADYAPLTPEPIADLQKGEKLIIIGQPRGLENVATEGIFGSIQESEGAKYLQLSMAVNPGNSGGPALTDRGKVAGVVTFKFKGEGIGLAIPGDVLQQALHDVEYLPVDDIQKNISRWRARQAGSRLLLGCQLSAVILQGYLRAHLVAAEAGIDPPQVLNANVERYQRVFDQMGQICDDIERVMLWTKTAPLDRPGVELLEQLEARYRSARLSAKNNLSMPPADLRRELGQLVHDFQELEATLKRTYGVMDFQSPLLNPIEVTK